MIQRNERSIFLTKRFDFSERVTAHFPPVPDEDAMERSPGMDAISMSRKGAANDASADQRGIARETDNQCVYDRPGKMPHRSSINTLDIS
jgi:hypothetical protein